MRKKLKMIKKVAFIALAAGMILSPVKGAAIPENVTGTVAYGADTSKTYGDFKYTVVNNSYVRIKKYIGQKSKVIIPKEIEGYKVKQIGNRAFANRKVGVENVIIPGTVERIGNRAFFNCKNLKSVKLSKGTKKIGESAFWNSGLQSINLPEGLKTIGGRAFARCENLKSIELPKSITEVADNTFWYCGIQSIKLPENLKKIQYQAFDCCYNLKKIYIPDGVNSIEESAFKWHNAKFKIECNKGSYAYNYANKNKLGISVSGKVVSKDKTTERVMKNFAYNIVNNSYVEIYKHLEFEKNVVIPDKIEGYKVTVIGNAAFHEIRPANREEWKWWNESTTSYRIHDDTTESVKLPKSLKTIGSSAFQGCTALKKIEIPDGVTKIGDYAFANTRIEYLSIPNGVERIESRTFAQCKELKTVNLPAGLKYIEYGAFMNSGIESINIPKGVKRIEWRTFLECKNLKNVKLNEGLRYIEKGAFSESGIESIIIPKGVKEIKDDAFYKCNKLKTVKLNKGLKYIGSAAFTESGIESITIPKGAVAGRRSFYSCSKLKTVKFSKGVESIDDEAFNSCKELTKAIIPNSVKKIGKNAFAWGNANFKIECSKNSHAYTYAVNNGIGVIEK